MFFRAISLLLTAAVVACPVCCAGGFCHAGQCRGTEQSPRESQRPCCRHGDSAGCRGERSSRDQNEPAPGKCPEGTTCQGVCGGAVFEKPCVLDDVTASFFLPLSDADISVACQVAHGDAFGVDDHTLAGDSYGRFLRTLHMSLLC